MTRDQHTGALVDALLAAGRDEVFIDNVSSKFAGWPGLDKGPALVPTASATIF